MRKLSEIRGEDALCVLADIIEPASEFAEDSEFVRLVRNGDKIQAVKRVLKEHKKAILTIMAILEGADPTTYSPSMIELPARLLELMNDPELVMLFPSQQTVTSSGPAMETTEEAGNGSSLS